MDSKDIEQLLIKAGYSEFGARQQRRIIDMLDGELAQVVIDAIKKAGRISHD